MYLLVYNENFVAYTMNIIIKNKKKQKKKNNNNIKIYKCVKNRNTYFIHKY